MSDFPKNIVINGGSGFIGTNLVEYFNAKGWQVLNLDINPPRNTKHQPYWQQVDILNRDQLIEAIRDFSPSVLLHFAARTDLDEKQDLRGYNANMDGVRNIMAAVQATLSIQRTVIASSQLVCKIGYKPKDEQDYCPTTLYGESKVITERIVRETGTIGSTWTLVRPTSIWGPWFDVPYKNFFETIQNGYYVHPGGIQAFKGWGFVLNSVFQVDKLIHAPAEKIHQKTFYLADYEPLVLREFANLIQQAMNVRPIISVPYWLLRAVGWGGDLLQKFGWKNPPLTSFRLHNIVTNEVQDLNPLERIAGELPYSVAEGVRLTVDWMNKSNNPEMD